MPKPPQLSPEFVTAFEAAREIIIPYRPFVYIEDQLVLLEDTMDPAKQARLESVATHLGLHGRRKASL